MPARHFLLLAAPLPIVAASMAITSWVKSAPSDPPARNEAVVRGQDEFLMAEAPTKKPARNAPRDKAAAMAAACRTTAKNIAARLGDECHTIARSPFVLAGDMSDEDLAAWHRDTIAPAAEAIAHRYCRTPPSEPITILLFTGEDSYNKFAKSLYGDEGISVYGYYKRGDRTLVMNIGTGGGTLVHELTHALVDFDFPDLPDWFNEGLASLHEQCRFRKDDDGPWIEGLVNWRLPGLKEAIKKNRLRSIESLVADDDFRGEHVGLNYAHARYLCLWLQRRGLLTDFYRDFRANQQDDPLGLATLHNLLDDRPWNKIDAEFERFVAELN